MSVLSLETFEPKAFCEVLRQYPSGQLVRDARLCILDVLDALYDLEKRELIPDASETDELTVGELLQLVEGPPVEVPVVRGECD